MATQVNDLIVHRLRELTNAQRSARRTQYASGVAVVTLNACVQV